MRERAHQERDLQLLELEPDASWEDVEDAYERLVRRYSPGSLASYGLFRVKERETFLEALKSAYLRLLDDAEEEEAGGGGFGGAGGGTPEGRPERGPTDTIPAEQHTLEREELRGSAHPPMTQTGAEEGPAGLPKLHVTPQATASRPQSRASWMQVAVAQDEIYTPRRLTQLREAQRTTREQLALHSGVPLRLFDALEQENYAAFGSSRQVRRVLRVYAKALELEPRRLVVDGLTSYWAWRTKARRPGHQRHDG